RLPSCCAERLLAGAHGRRLSGPLSEGHSIKRTYACAPRADLVTSVLDITEVRDARQLTELVPEWWELWRQVPTATPFQSPPWLLAWWEAFAPGQMFAIAVQDGLDLVAL